MSVAVTRNKNSLAVAMAIPLLAGAFYILGNLPTMRGVVGLYLAVCVILIWRWPDRWLMIFVAAIPAFDVTFWTGRIIVNEFDALVLMVVAVVLVRDKTCYEKPGWLALAPLLGLVLLSGLSTWLALDVYPDLDSGILEPYKSFWNSFRVSKATLYALFLYLLVACRSRQYRVEALYNLSIGAGLGLIVIALIILWEKNVLAAVLEFDVWGALSRFFRFHQDMRPTAFFSGMHIGGSAIDSYLCLSFALVLFAFSKAESPKLKLLLAVALLAGFYAILSTVSRAVMASAVLSLSIWGGLELHRIAIEDGLGLRKTFSQILAIFVVLLLQIASQNAMGSDGVIYFVLFVVAFAGLASLPGSGGRKTAIAAAVLISIALVVESAFDRVGKGESLYIVFLRTGIFLTCVASANWIIKRFFFLPVNNKAYRLPLALGLVAGALISVALGASSLADRFREIGTSVLDRDSQWETVWRTREGSPRGLWVGNGPGTMPLLYLVNYLETRDVFLVQKALDGDYLEITGKGQALVQRVSVDSRAMYKVVIDVIVEDPEMRFYVRICNRNIIEQSTNPNCTRLLLRADGKIGEQQLMGLIEPTHVGPSGLTNHPQTFVIEMTGRPFKTNLRRVSLFSPGGEDILVNGDFSQDLDHWMFVSDYDHLSWHAKNMFLHQLIELGVFGLFGLIFMMGSVLLVGLQAKKIRQFQLATVALALAMSALLLGSFVTVLDNPRSSMLFFFSMALIVSLRSLHVTPNEKLKHGASDDVSPASGFSPSVSNGTKIHPGIIKATTLVAGLFISGVIGLHFWSEYRYGASLAQVATRLLLDRKEIWDMDYPSTVELRNFLQQALPSDNRKMFGETNKAPAVVWADTWKNNLVGPSTSYRVGEQLYDNLGRPTGLSLARTRGAGEVNYTWRQTVYISTSIELLSYVRKAEPGTRIILRPGTYEFKGQSISVLASGEKFAPIHIGAEKLGEVRLKFDMLEGFHVLSPYWIFENLEIEGVCNSDSACEHAFHIVGNAQNIVVRNNIIKNFNSHLKINGSGKDHTYPDGGLIEYNALINDSERKTTNPTTPLDVVGASDWMVRRNFVADFSRGDGFPSYGMFFKGGGSNNVFEQNAVLCEFRHKGGVRVGLSFGSGLTAKDMFRPGTEGTEQFNSIMRDNLVANCPLDVGIYLAKSSGSSIINNMLINSLGIDVRFPSSEAFLVGNRVSGRIYVRDSATKEEIGTTSLPQTVFDPTTGFHNKEIIDLLSRELALGRPEQ